MFFLGENSSEKKTDNESEKIHTRELKRILNKVDEIRRQRSELHNKLRESISQDDLTRLLVTATAESKPLDHLFAEQISKHQPLVSIFYLFCPSKNHSIKSIKTFYQVLE